MPEFCKAERDGHVLIVTFTRPERMNALHSPAHYEMDAIFNDFEKDPNLWVAILTGAGDRAFSAGNDLKWQAEGGTRERPASGFGGITFRFDRTKPLIAAVNGIAMGGGFELALAADIIIAAESAVFALPEPRVGLAALAGGLQRLPRQIGLKHAMGMILTGRRVGAQEAYQLGFANEVVPDAQLLRAARRWADQILECAPLSVRGSKQAVLEGLGRPLDEAMRARYSELEAMLRHPDFVEGPRAFAEKRRPDWTGW